ncbi:ABC transporter permease [Mucilaginibacter sp. UR6-1]|uniref:ABC transporter permease n=1 Tax=Mucilaginibacter sp. UR6-1 TaxID=1435643 RepID=UPI001E3F6A21|nr:ABC transporter permease [Mucilaginibacter sp. UR6-1]MCC8411253.1 ABC transporter permease [Mucilaginibacter sp. UR6-1]
MLKNYFKIAIAVLRRRKFFTFISLFGISFTLTVLMVLAAFIDRVGNSNYPDKKRDRSLYILSMEMQGTKNGYYNRGPHSFYFLEHYAGSLKSAEKIAISSMFDYSSTYVNNKKVAINQKYTNAAYWQVLDYDFLEGKPFTPQQVANAERVAVISEDTKTAYFGNIPSVVGKYIEADDIKYRVTGVVKNVPITQIMMYGDMYLPYTLSKGDYKTNKGFNGNFSAIVLAKSAADLPKIKKEYAGIVARIPITDKDYDHIYSFADTYFVGLVRTILGNGNNSGVGKVITGLGIFVFLFMLLPTINLVNINITRIMERSSEIGVRKAFGASSRTLVYQFIVENIILTLLGGLIGIVLTLVVMSLINNAGLIANLNLTINYTVLACSLLACLVFGLLSGVYPAWRMSRLNVVNALKAK